MTMLSDELAERKEEFEAHFGLATALQDRLMLEATLGGFNLSARHLNTIKSGLIVHIYNIVEALMTLSLRHLGSALGTANPREWTEHSLKEWLRANIVDRTSKGPEDSRLNAVFEWSQHLLNQGTLGPQSLKKPSGTWNDTLIKTFTKRMKITFNIPPEMQARMAESPRYRDKTPLQLVADLRNAIAHGRRSFENGASELDLTEIRELADITFEYMYYTVTSVQSHVESRAYLVVPA
jgi:hypothetical protein